MNKKIFALVLLFCFAGVLFSAGLDPQQFGEPVRYDKDSGESPEDFFEREYSELWDSLPEYEQFAIACTSNNFERNHDFHLDLCTRINFENDSEVGKRILNRDGVYNHEQLIKELNDIPSAFSPFDKYQEALEKNPELSLIKFASIKDYTIEITLGLYYLNSKKALLSIHFREAWIAARKIAVIRWGLGAGYISEKEAVELIIPIVEQVKNDFSSFEDFNAHWIACYCFNFFEKDEISVTIDRLVKATQAARAYIPFERLAFSGKNADKEHQLTVEQLSFLPDENVKKLNSLYLLKKTYFDDKYSEETLTRLIEEEADDEDISNLACNLHLALMQKLSTPQERIDYLESKWNFICTIEDKNGTYPFAVTRYITDLITLYKPQKVVDLYNTLPQEFQTDLDIYFYYGYANYLLANLSSYIIERDVYISRAVTVFSKLRKKGYELGEYFSCWLNALESL